MLWLACRPLVYQTLYAGHIPIIPSIILITNQVTLGEVVYMGAHRRKAKTHLEYQILPFFRQQIFPDCLI